MVQTETCNGQVNIVSGHCHVYLMSISQAELNRFISLFRKHVVLVMALQKSLFSHVKVGAFVPTCYKKMMLIYVI